MQPVEEKAENPEITLEEIRTEDVVAETPAVEETATEAAVEAPAFAQFQAPKPPKKSKKKLIGWLSAAAAVVVAGAVTIGALWEPIQGVIVENFGSDEDYLSYVEQNSTEKLTDTLSGAYVSMAEMLTAEPASGAYEVNMKLTVGDKVISMAEEMLKQQAGEKIELDWLSSIDLAMNVNAKDSLEQIGMALNIGQTEIAKLDAILNMDKGEVFLAIPTLSDKYLKGEMDITAAMPNEVLDLLSSEELQKALPSEKEMDALLDKYIGIVFDNLQDVEKSSETVKIAGVQQKLTALETEIDQDDVVKIVTAMLKAAKDDKQIEKIINNLAKFMEENDLIEDADDAYDAFVEGVEEALDAMEYADMDGDFEVVLTDYVNDSHEVVGRRIEVNGQEILYYAEVRNGSKLAFELEMEGLQIYGEGTEKKGVINAEYTIWAGDAEICDITLVDFKAEGETLNGKIRIAPSSDLLENMGLASAGASAIALMDPQLELGFENTKASSKVEINLLSGSDTLIGLAVTGKEVKSGKITLPDDKNVYDQDEAEEWLQEMDVEKLLDKLDELGLPIEEILQGQAVSKPVTPNVEAQPAIRY